MAEEYFRAVLKSSKLKSKILEPVRRVLNSGSGLVRFYLAGGALQVEFYLGKYCYPKMSESGELESVTIRYMYEDEDEKDANGKAKCMWQRIDLGTQSDIKYKEVEYKSDQNPEDIQWEVESQADHNLGFVQAEWLRTSIQRDSVDGVGLTADLCHFVDELNYSLSQSSTAVAYNQDPQLTLKNMDEEEMMGLVRSSMKAWNLGREGEASFLESGLNGVERAIELRDKVRLNLQDISRVVMLDPEKIVGSAQSGKALEIIHGPMVDLIHELRPIFEQSLNSLVLKIGLLYLMSNAQGMPVPLVIPPGFQPESLEIEWDWPSVFPQTMADLKEKISVATAAAAGNLISRETMTKWLAKDFGIKDVEEEIAKIAAQPVINPFGGF
jgi:hypothetical protein